MAFEWIRHNTLFPTQSNLTLNYQPVTDRFAQISKKIINVSVHQNVSTVNTVQRNSPWNDPGT